VDGFKFNAATVREPSARQTKFSDKWANSAGQVPRDVLEFSRVCGTFKERRSHACRTPEAVLDRIIRVASNPRDLVVDPMCGTGTTPAVAERLGRQYLGIELCEATAAIARRRLSPLEFIGSH
jgi:DNA modification methylase